MLPKERTDRIGSDSESSDDSSEDYLIMSKSMIQQMQRKPVQPDFPSMRDLSDDTDDSEDEPVLPVVSSAAVAEAELEVVKNQKDVLDFDEPPAAIGKPDSVANNFFCTPVRAPAPRPCISSVSSKPPKLPLPGGWRKIENTIGQD